MRFMSDKQDTCIFLLSSVISGIFTSLQCDGGREGGRTEVSYRLPQFFITIYEPYIFVHVFSHLVLLFH